VCRSGGAKEKAGTYVSSFFFGIDSVGIELSSQIRFSELMSVRTQGAEQKKFFF